MAKSNPDANLMLSAKASDSNLTVSLHPLVLLTASDLLTRHKLRNETGPLAGIILGQQKGRQITAEHAFAASLKQDGGQWSFEKEWTETRIQQYKLVHQSPALDVVGWFTLCPQDGPLPSFSSLQSQITNSYNESAILLALHPEAIFQANTTNGKLPVTIYESVVEADISRDDVNTMQVDGEESASIKFRSIPYSIETDETEMIAIDYVAKGAGSATHPTAEEETEITESQSESTEQSRSKKRPEKSTPTNSTTQTTTDEQQEHVTLTTEEADHMASLNTRLNSVKMLQSRLQLLSSFIKTLPSSNLPDTSTPQTTEIFDSSHIPHLRNIQALLTRLSLLTPTETPSITQTQQQYQQQPLQTANQAQSNDVALASLLSLLGQDIQSLSELGRKAVSVENTKSSRRGRPPGTGNTSGGAGATGGGGMMDDTSERSGFARGGGMLV